MATTSPDNIRTPDPSGAFDPPADFARMANDVQDTFTRRGNLYVGTSAQRSLLSDPQEGIHWQDTNGDKYEWVFRDGSWRGARTIGGTISLSGAANTTRSQIISFPPGYFESTPSIQVSVHTTSPQNLVGVSFTAPSTAGADIRLRYSTTSTITVSWTATPI